MRNKFISLALVVIFILGSSISVRAEEEDILENEPENVIQEDEKLPDHYSVPEVETEMLEKQGTYSEQKENTEKQAVIINQNLESISEVDANGLKWEVANGVLRISGNGVIEGKSASAVFADTPEVKNGVTAIIVDEGITRIESGAFIGCSNTEKISIASSVKSFGGEGLFYRFFALRTVVFRGDAPVMDVGAEIGAFNSVTATVYYPLGNQTYTEELKRRYEGNLTWEAREPLEIILEATDDTYTKGSSKVTTITCNGKVNDFVGLNIDGNKVDENNYTLGTDSMAVFINAEHLNTLASGKHIVNLNYIYGSIDAELIILEDKVQLKIILETTKNTHVLGTSDTAIIVCNGELKDFVNVFVGGSQVDTSDYSLAEGSTILTFAAKYLNTLSVGKHAVTLNYTYASVDTELIILPPENSTNTTDGSGTTEKVNISERSGAVQTGDSVAMVVWLLNALIAIVVSIGIVLVKRKRSTAFFVRTRR